MSLILSFISKNKIEEPNAGLFGFESWRTTLWGNEIIKKLGCKMIASLKYKDVYAIGDQILMLKEELLIIKDNAILISTKIGFIDPESILFRVENALGYIEVAEKKRDHWCFNNLEFQFIPFFIKKPCPFDRAS